MHREEWSGGVWSTDAEYATRPGEPVAPNTLVTKDLNSGHEIRLLGEELTSLRKPPYPIGPNALFISYSLPAEFSAHLALNWGQFPKNAICLYTEFRRLTNQNPSLAGSGLLAAAAYYDIDHISHAEKSSMRALAMRGEPWTPAERKALLDYCAEDVYLAGVLWEKMRPLINIPQALLRGEFLKSIALMEFRGIPIDMEMWEKIQRYGTRLPGRLIDRIDRNYGVYSNGHFRMQLMRDYLRRNEIPWPELLTGGLDLDSKTFKRQSEAYPQLEALRELRVTLGQLRLNSLAVGRDGRNRVGLRPFASKTSRCQPSNAEYIFGPAKWMRYLIKPEEGTALVHLDWTQQEFGIAAGLSRDRNMLTAYRSGDCYLAFGIQAGAIPRNATKASHPIERSRFKQCVLATQYGQGAEALAERIGQPVCAAQHLLNLHHETYREYWKWITRRIDGARLDGWIETFFGWRMHVNSDTTVRTLQNFPAQAHGAETLRLACIDMMKKELRLIAPVHDAILLECDLAEVDDVIREGKESMAWAGMEVMGAQDFELRTEAQVTRYSDRFTPDTGAGMWGMVSKLLLELEQEESEEKPWQLTL